MISLKRAADRPASGGLAPRPEGRGGAKGARTAGDRPLLDVLEGGVFRSAPGGAATQAQGRAQPLVEPLAIGAPTRFPRRRAIEEPLLGRFLAADEARLQNML